MTTDELIAMAREADPFGDDGRLVSLAMLTPETLARFAALVAAREREAMPYYTAQPGESATIRAQGRWEDVPRRSEANK